VQSLNAICPRAAELGRCNGFSNCRTLGVPIGQMDLKVMPAAKKATEDEFKLYKYYRPHQTHEMLLLQLMIP